MNGALFASARGIRQHLSVFPYENARKHELNRQRPEARAAERTNAKKMVFARVGNKKHAKTRYNTLECRTQKQEGYCHERQTHSRCDLLHNAPWCT